ncbi:MAG: hypothetical protein J6Z50_06055 [Fibrobacterales bacterium]|nr:hypothetical protein [Fibrobacterales bacterium]
MRRARRTAFFAALLLLLGTALPASARDIDFSPLAGGGDPDSISQVGAWAEAEPGAKDSVSESGGLAVETKKDPPKYIQRDFDHKEQVVVGSAMMACLALIMVTMNNYNPK